MRLWRWAALCLLIALCARAQAARFYDLAPERIARDTYVFVGAREAMDFDNHANVVNTGFIVTVDGVIVIDTGPSRLYGEAMRAAIARVTDQPVARVYITHAHPDHFLGNAAFDDVPVAALAAIAATIRRDGKDMTARLYEQVGAAMRGTRAVAPTATIVGGERPRFGAHRLRLIATAGHSAADLMIYDETTGVLFAGDVVFHERAPATPNADLDGWLQALAVARDLAPRVVVPGHGPVDHGTAAIAQTRAYLVWLRDRFTRAAAAGESAAELMFAPLPPRWAVLAVQPAEYRRSVVALYPAIERAALTRADD